MNTIRVDSGPKAEIISIVEKSGKCPAHDFLKELPESDRKKVFMLFRLFCNSGEIRNIEKFRKEGDPIWRFKSFQIRIFCFFSPTASKRCLILTDGFKKQQNKMPKSEIERAKRYYRQFIHGEKT